MRRIILVSWVKVKKFLVTVSYEPGYIMYSTSLYAFRFWWYIWNNVIGKRKNWLPENLHNFPCQLDPLGIRLWNGINSSCGINCACVCVMGEWTLTKYRPIQQGTPEQTLPIRNAPCWAEVVMKKWYCSWKFSANCSPSIWNLDVPAKPWLENMGQTDFRSSSYYPILLKLKGPPITYLDIVLKITWMTKTSTIYQHTHDTKV